MTQSKQQVAQAKQNSTLEKKRLASYYRNIIPSNYQKGDEEAIIKSITKLK
jgi:hypothetical protein